MISFVSFWVSKFISNNVKLKILKNEKNNFEN